MQKLSFQEIILKLLNFWSKQGCTILQPYDMEVGAGTFHPATALNVLGPNPLWKVAYVQPCRRPTDGRYGENPNRLQHYYQFQVIIQPSPDNIQDLYLKSLKEINLDHLKHDIRFVEDDWESPTLGAAGLGWEVWCDGMEVTQFTYFQQVGGFEVRPVAVEITYGLERLAMFIQELDDVYSIDFNGLPKSSGGKSYGDIFKDAEKEYSEYNFEKANVDKLFNEFDNCVKECDDLISSEKPLVKPAYDQCIKASHIFNLLDARGVISVSERQAYILKVRNMSKSCCSEWIKRHEN